MEGLLYLDWPSANQEIKDGLVWSLSKWFVHKAVFLANPSMEPRLVVMVFYGRLALPRLAFCKPGDKGWTRLEFPVGILKFHFIIPQDAVYHNGQFYVLCTTGYVAAFDIGRRIDDNDLLVKRFFVATPREKETIMMAKVWYLAVLDEKLVRFELRLGCFPLRGTSDCDDMNHPLQTYGIKIQRFDESKKQWVKVESLGDKVVFLGYNTSFALSASDYSAGHCIPNSIYFISRGLGNQYTEKVCYDMGIYSVKDKIVKPLYPPMPMEDDDDASQFRKPAPIWIVNSADGV